VMKNTLCCLSFTVLLMTVPVQAQQVNIGIEQFERWIFQNVSNAEQARMTLASAIELEIARIEQVTPLLEPQKERLRLAGQGDIKRFYDRVERARQEFRELEGNVDQNNIGKIHAITVPLSQDIQKGLFGSKSLFKKVVLTTVNEQQAVTMRAEEKRQQRVRMENAIKVFIAQTGRQMPLTAIQRESLLKLAMDDLDHVEAKGIYATYLMTYRLSELPREKFQAIFDEAQMKAFDKTLRQPRAMKAALVQQGLLDDE